MSFAAILVYLATATLIASGPNNAQDHEKTETLTFADGKLSLTVPRGWKSVEPRYRMIDLELSIPPVEGDDEPGRITIMGAGGSVQANIDRWVTQVTQPDGSATRDQVETAQKEINGLKVHLVDIAGTYLDRRGPQGEVTLRPEYRLIAAIIETDGFGNYFVKSYGPKDTMAENATRFAEFIESIKVDE